MELNGMGLADLKWIRVAKGRAQWLNFLENGR